MKLKSSNHSPSVAARASFVFFVFFVVKPCVALASALSTVCCPLSTASASEH